MKYYILIFKYYIGIMTRYSITRKRNIKKYKKSRTGRGKGRRSIRRCKTRKPKGFKKAKRYTVGKRRRMMVGGADFDFNVDADDLQVFMSSGIEKYRSPFSQKYIMYNGDSIITNCDGTQIIDPTTSQPKTKEKKHFYGFEKVVLVAKGFALVTKTGTLFSGTNRKEQLNVFACYLRKEPGDTYTDVLAQTRPSTIPLCYAIVRCSNKSGCNDESRTNPRLKPNSNMDSKILFLFVKNPQTTNPSTTTGAALREYRVNTGVIVLDPKTVDRIRYNVFEFTNNLTSDDDTYRILVPQNEEDGLNLNKFFSAVSTIIRAKESGQGPDYTIPLQTEVDETHIKMRRECVGPDSQGSDSSGGVSVVFEALSGLG
jgi:hypothetical protein